MDYTCTEFVVDSWGRFSFTARTNRHTYRVTAATDRSAMLWSEVKCTCHVDQASRLRLPLLSDHHLPPPPPSPWRPSPWRPPLRRRNHVVTLHMRVGYSSAVHARTGTPGLASHPPQQPATRHIADNSHRPSTHYIGYPCSTHGTLTLTSDLDLQPSLSILYASELWLWSMQKSRLKVNLFT